MHSAEWAAAVNIAIGWALTFTLGFEREVRGAPAGDRTFSMIGLSAALIGTVAPHYPAVLGGAVTGIGFIGGGLCFRQAVKQHEQEREILHGVTTAASIFGAAAIGAIAGCGQLILACAATLGILLSLEIRHIPILRYLDARRWAHLFNDDSHRHFKLHDIERALIHPHPHQEHADQEHLGLSQDTVIGAAALAAVPATVSAAMSATATATAAAAAVSEANADEDDRDDALEEVGGDVVGVATSVIDDQDDSLLQEAEAASILANEVMISGAMRGAGR